MLAPAKARRNAFHDDPASYLNAELSWLQFNDRVLEEAADRRNPLFERLTFCAIYDTNLDEFFMIRVAAIKAQIAAGVLRRSDDGRTPSEQLEAVSRRVRASKSSQMRLLCERLLPSLASHGIRIVRIDELDEEAQAHLERVFDERIFAVLTPLAVDSGHPFPYISNLSLSLAVELEESTADGVALHFARVKIPQTLPRFVAVEPSHGEERRFVLLEDLIARHLGSLFSGMAIRDAYLFRVTRDADLDLQEDEADDLLEAIESELARRRFGEPVRLEVERGMPAYMREFLLESLDLHADDCYEIDGMMALGNLRQLIDLPGHDDLRFPAFAPSIPKRLRGASDLFALIREGDVLLHHPYHSFDPVLQFLAQAATDERVLAIKATLYRTSGSNSPVVRALLEAAENGKQVAVVIELKARFDEENNIEWAKRLERAGVHVVYGFPGLKVHAKALAVVRQDDDGLRRYLHFGTGNYNEKTARIYSDLGLFTCRPRLGSDALVLFNALTGFAKVTDFDDLFVSPVTMRRDVLSRIERETEHARAGRPAGIRAKINALTDLEVVRALYRASEGGVQVDLLVRGMCVLRPGVPGLSSRVRVRSVVGRFLEHSRIYIFDNGGEREAFISSADWMARSFDRRVELAAPVASEALVEVLDRQIFSTLWADDAKGRELLPDGSYERLTLQGGRQPKAAQQAFLSRAHKT
ncbi:MAG: polyphosphate kinase 1 [Candidatus Tyrphobacter sp.]